MKITDKKTYENRTQYTLENKETYVIMGIKNLPFNYDTGDEIHDIKRFIDKIYSYNYNAILDEAAKKLSHAAYSENKMRKFFEKQNYPADVSENVMKYLKQHKFIDDVVFAENITRKNKDKFESKRRIMMKIQSKGISKEDAINAVSDFDEEYEENSAYMYACKKMKTYSGKSDEEIRKKLMYSLSYRGFSYNTIKKVIDKILK